MDSTTITIIAFSSLGVSALSATVCLFAFCKRLDTQAKVLDSHIVKVKSQRDIKTQDLMNEMNVIKNEMKSIQETNKELTNKMTKTIQKVLGEEWTAYFDENHQAYYWFNKQTGETTWVNPVDAI